MNWNKLITLLILILILGVQVSCTTYKKFYGITHTSIPSLPIGIKKTTKLRMLNISKNPKLNLKKVFEQLKNHHHLQILILDSLDIKELPTSINQFKQLTQLSIANNPRMDLEKIAEQLKDLPLTFLNLKGNQIKTLPENISSITSIKDLNLSYNALQGEKNYEILSKLPRLYSLWIDHNEIDELPKTIGLLRRLRFFYLDHNNLNTLPIEMSGMKRTWVIHAGFNQFTELPEVFTKMKGLLMAHMNNNLISSFPVSYNTEKYALAGLILDNNPIDESQKIRAKKMFKKFFLLSFEQK